MANEIRTQISQSVTNGNLSDSVSLAFQTDQATAVLADGVQIVGTTHEALSLGDVTSMGPSTIVNLDATNFVELGIDQAGSFVPVLEIAAGEAQTGIKAASGVTLYVQADTASVKIRRFIPSL